MYKCCTQSPVAATFGSAVRVQRTFSQRYNQVFFFFFCIFFPLNFSFFFAVSGEPSLNVRLQLYVASMRQEEAQL
jgi:hypothetical protein